MLRTTLIHILILLAPTILYVAWLLLARRAHLSRARWAATFRAMPWLRLLGGGLVLAAASLVALALLGGADPGGTYVPPHLLDGEVVPAKVVPAKVVPTDPR